MHAIVDRDGRLIWVEVPEPEVAAGEALVEVHATALNRADLLQRAGRYSPPPGASQILGLEAAGRVVSAPPQSGYEPGDRVCALLTGGGYAERVAVPLETLMPMPRSWSMEQGAAFPEAFFTAYLNLFMEGGLQEGETVLIHGGASGVGTAAIAMAREAGCRVAATAGSEEKVARCRELGAELAIVYKQEDFAERIVREFGSESVDLILDIVGAEYLERNLELLATAGRLVVIATLGGRSGTLDLRKLMRKRAVLRGSTLRSRPLAEKERIRDSLWQRFGTSLREGSLQPVIDRVMPISEAEEAHQRMRSNANIGKIVLKVA